MSKQFSFSLPVKLSSALPARLTPLFALFCLVAIAQAQAQRPAESSLPDARGARTENQSPGQASNEQAQVKMRASKLNAEGLRLLNENKFQAAIEKLEAAAKLLPGDQSTRANLAIAHNNYGMKLQNTPQAALDQFHLAAFLDPQNSTINANLSFILKKLGHNPEDFNVRMNLAKQAKSQNKCFAAIAEFQAALKMAPDAAGQEALGDLFSTLGYHGKAVEAYRRAIKLSESASLQTKLAKAVQAQGETGAASAPAGGAQMDAQRTFMESLEAKVRKQWSPPQGEEFIPVTVKFNIHEDGQLGNVELVSPCKSTAASDAALKAIRLSAPFEKLSEHAAEEREVEYSFGYKGLLADNSLGPICFGSIVKKYSKNSGNKVEDIDFEPYFAKIERQIKRAWYPPKCEMYEYLRVAFKIYPDGTVADLRLVQSSASDLAIGAALRAIRAASPLPALPGGGTDPLDLQFAFDKRSIVKAAH